MRRLIREFCLGDVGKNGSETAPPPADLWTRPHPYGGRGRDEPGTWHRELQGPVPPPDILYGRPRTVHCTGTQAVTVGVTSIKRPVCSLSPPISSAIFSSPACRSIRRPRATEFRQGHGGRLRQALVRAVLLLGRAHPLQFILASCLRLWSAGTGTCP